MKPADIRSMSADQLQDELLKLKKEQLNLRFQRVTSQVENTSRFRQIRRTIARILTVLQAKRNADTQAKA